MFPLPILQLLIDYNASAICKECLKYFPRGTACNRSVGHEYRISVSDRGLSLIPSIVDGVCSWPRPQDQEMWTTLFATLTAKQNILGQKVKTLNDVQYGDSPHSAFMAISSNGHELSVTYRHYTHKPIFKIQNIMKPRKKRITIVVEE